MFYFTHMVIFITYFTYLNCLIDVLLCLNKDSCNYAILFGNHSDWKICLKTQRSSVIKKNIL
ncbi:MAG: hypothetical protein K0S23_877 [Fluviicola sp.]|jgi:hypothetical protein|nr:hypothetical protein [Fluviicola sp.]